MPPGRKKTTNITKRIRGTDQPCRKIEEIEVEKIIKIPSAPKFLTKTGKKIYRTLGQSLMVKGIINELNILSFALLCSELSKYIEFTLELEIEGYAIEVKDPTGKFTVDYRVNPKSKLADNAFKNAAKMAPEFGMTPAGLTRIAVMFQPDKPKNPYEDFLNGGY